MSEEELEKEAEEWVDSEYDNSYFPDCNFSAKKDAIQAYIAGAEAHQPQWHKVVDGDLPSCNNLFDFVIQYEDGKFKCKYKYGKEFESIDGKTWKEIIPPKESE